MAIRLQDAEVRVMHFYPFHIGDYASHTRHLTPMEDLAYRRLLDLYYLTERPIPAAAAARLVGMTEHATAVTTVLEEFFVLGDAGYTNQRADEEIGRYATKVRLAKAAGKASGARRSNGRSADAGRPLNGRATIQEPRTKTSTQEPVPVLLRPSGPGQDAPRPSGGQDDQPSAQDPAGGSGTAELLAALRKTSYRANARNRTHHLLEAVRRLDAAGITPHDLLALAQRAIRKGKKPHGLFATWVDDIPEALKELGKR